MSLFTQNAIQTKVNSGFSEEQLVLVEKKEIPKLISTWQSYDMTIRALAKEVFKSGWEFDTIVCIARGGAYVGDPLSRLFKKPLGYTMTTSYREENGTVQGKLIISKHIAMVADKLGKRVLLVDDLTDTGVTIEEVKRKIKEDHKDVEEIRTALLWNKSGSKFTPDYFAEKVDKKLWIEQPFEFYDNIELKDL